MLVRAVLRTTLPLAIVLGASVLGGCYREVYVEPAPRVERAEGQRVFVRVADTQVRGDRVLVNTWVQNDSDRPMVVHRNELALRLADGRVIQSPRRRSKPLVIRPGRARHVTVGFIAPPDADIADARLLMNGVQFGRGARQALGEIALTGEESVLNVGPRVAGAEAAPEPAPAEKAEPEEDSDEAEPADPQQGPAAEPEDDGSWQVGGG